MRNFHMNTQRPQSKRSIISSIVKRDPSLPKFITLRKYSSRYVATMYDNFLDDVCNVTPISILASMSDELGEISGSVLETLLCSLKRSQKMIKNRSSNSSSFSSNNYDNYVSEGVEHTDDNNNSNSSKIISDKNDGYITKLIGDDSYDHDDGDDDDESTTAMSITIYDDDMQVVKYRDSPSYLSSSENLNEKVVNTQKSFLTSLFSYSCQSLGIPSKEEFLETALGIFLCKGTLFPDDNNSHYDDDTGSSISYENNRTVSFSDEDMTHLISVSFESSSSGVISFRSNNERMEVDYLDATWLYKLIEVSEWDKVLKRMESHQNEVQTWICKSKSSLNPSAPTQIFISEDSGILQQRNDKNTMMSHRILSPSSQSSQLSPSSWKILPLHAACIFGCPRDVLEVMIKYNPKSVDACCVGAFDSNSKLPLHLACYLCNDPQVVDALIIASPGTIFHEDGFGYLPLHLAVISKGPARNDVLEVLYKYLGHENVQTQLIKILSRDSMPDRRKAKKNKKEKKGFGAKLQKLIRRRKKKVPLVVNVDRRTNMTEK